MTRTQTDREALLADILGDIEIAEKLGHDTDILHVTAHQLRREIAVELFVDSLNPYSERTRDELIRKLK